MSRLAGWTPGSHTHDGRTHDTYRKGSGPGVVVVSEVPGLTQEVVGFAEELVGEGYTVVLPHLFGRLEPGYGAGDVARTIGRVCVSREFTLLRTGRTSPVAGWLRTLARRLHDEVGGPGVGAIGMCLTGGFALAMMVDPTVVAPVLAQPSLPLPLTRRGRADLGLSPADLDAVRDRARAGCRVLGLRYRDDIAVGTRFSTLRTELGDAFIAVELPGRKHSTLTVHRQDEAVSAVKEFLAENLVGGPV